MLNCLIDTRIRIGKSIIDTVWLSFFFSYLFYITLDSFENIDGVWSITENIFFFILKLNGILFGRVVYEILSNLLNTPYNKLEEDNEENDDNYNYSVQEQTELLNKFEESNKALWKIHSILQKIYKNQNF